MTSDSRTYLDPDVIEKISGLELKARLIVEGFISGLHKSPFRGFSVEFAEHREYVPGAVFLIPVLLSECQIPLIEIDATRTAYTLTSAT